MVISICFKKLKIRYPGLNTGVHKCKYTKKKGIYHKKQKKVEK